MSYENYHDVHCSAPCTMYSVLLENKFIDDPFYGMNEREARKLSDKPCEFTAVFDVSEAEYAKETAELTFWGLDTLCSIYLNEKLLGKTQNMHSAYSYKVKDMLKIGENTLRLCFSSPTEYFKKMNNRHFLATNGDTIPGAAHLRKVLSMSGWDWGPTLPDMGIFRPIELEFYDGEKIGEFSISQIHTENSVVLEIEAEPHKNAELWAEADGKRVLLSGGRGEIEIENPKLWWPRGYGEQNLYEVSVEAVRGGQVHERVSKKVGLRTLELSTEKSGDGAEFCFVVNGVKIFAMGANYVPEDSLVARLTPERTKRLIDSCIEANFNMIRVWGGGYYPEDCFYDMCDECGLLVWQDFGMACCNVWLRESFEESIKREAIYNVRRIAHHASLALLCGNNEVEEMQMWGMTDDLTKQDYLKLYEHILPDICEKYAPNTSYRSSSPSSYGGFNDPGREDVGDVHFWEVWHSSKPFEEYRKHKFRFCSEFGFESFPSYKTVKSFCDEKDLNPFSEVMENHQKCKGGNTKILNYLSENYLYPTSLENLIYASQLNQADAIKYGVEHFRRLRGYCMGSIYWQLNDCWPVASWSSIDYFGRWKALHYAAKKFYAPLMTALFEEESKITVCVSNETMNSKNGLIKYGVYDIDFNCKMSGEKEYFVNALTSEDVFCADVSQYSGNSRTFFVADTYDETGNFVMRQTSLFKKPKHFEWKKPNFTVKAEQKEGHTELYISADCYARSVEVDFDDYDAILSDNYFDITDKTPVKISVKSNIPAEKLLSAIRLKSVYDIR